MSGPTSEPLKFNLHKIEEKDIKAFEEPVPVKVEIDEPEKPKEYFINRSLGLMLL